MRASELGLSAKEVVDNVITALTSNGMIAPSYWVDPKTGNDYLLTVQYPENYREEPGRSRLRAAARAARSSKPTRLDSVSHISPHRRARPRWTITSSGASMDVYVAPTGEDLSQVLCRRAEDRATQTKLPENVRVNVRGSVQAMRASFQQLRPGADSLDAAGLSDPGGAVRVLPGSVPDPAGGADRADRRAADPVCHRHHAERHVADGRGDDGGHRGVQQHSDRGIHQRGCARKGGRCARRCRWPAGCGCVRC